jgi:hypothetical protein
VKTWKLLCDVNENHLKNKIPTWTLHCDMGPKTNKQTYNQIWLDVMDHCHFDYITNPILFYFLWCKQTSDNP